MTPEIIILNPKIKYRNKLKAYLEDNGFENVSVASDVEKICENVKSCAERLVIASGDEVMYSDLVRVMGGGEICQRVRFVLTYSGKVSADIGLAQIARSVSGGEDFEYLSAVVSEEIENYFSDSDDNYSESDFVREKLDCLGLRSTHKGYKYIAFAAGMREVEMITKDVYPDVARKYKTTSSSVERGIRSAVSYAWSRGGYAGFNKHIGWNSTKRPTNSEFIAALALRLRLEGLKHDGDVT